MKGQKMHTEGPGKHSDIRWRNLKADGGLADLLAEARSPNPRFAAVVVEDIERASRDFYNSIKLERELSDQGIPLFATDEPADIKGANPTTLLIRRIKQGFAEYFHLQLKEKSGKGSASIASKGGTSAKSPTGICPRKSPTPTRPKPPRNCPRPGSPWTRLMPRS
jgi:DNA invertase Pin-like site-specific DNA recombinase